ncbi:MAG: heavy metal translocating P-type ATPase [Rhodobacteraceae bacterium]|nr:heavy metal translocating P-type ATPase [Paracoccaceae bacterium]
MQQTSPPDPEMLSFEIDGLTCAGCVERAEQALASVPGVGEARVNLALRRADVTGSAAPEVLAQVLDAAGYPAARDSFALDVSGLTCASCVSRAEATLTGLPGVLSASVNLVTGRADLVVLRGALRPDDAAKALSAADYPTAPLTARTEAPVTPARREEATLRRDMVLAAALTLPVFVTEMGGHMIPALHHWLMASFGAQTLWLMQFLLTTLVLIGPGRRFFIHGFPALLRGAPDMNALVALGTGAAWAYSTVVVFAPGLLPAAARMPYFESAAVIVTLILLGRMLEARARGRAGAAIRELAGLRPTTARRLSGDGVDEVPLEAVIPGDLLRLLPGDRVPVDGVVTEGQGTVDEAALTGEPLPVAKSAGDAVAAGTINGTAPLTLRAERVGSETALAGIIRTVEAAQAARLPVQNLVNRITAIFVPAVLLVAALACGFWLTFGPAPAITPALVATVSVLIVACPCAMGLAVPMSILTGTGRASRLGVLFRGGDGLQRLEHVRLVAFDKTGTLTEGRPVLSGITAAPGWSEDRLLASAAGAEAGSEHPLACAVTEAAAVRNLRLPDTESIESRPGQGLTAMQDCAELRVGTAAWMSAEGIEIEPLAAALADAADRGETPVLVAHGDQLAGLMRFADRIRPESMGAIAGLQAQGIKTALISGDTEPAARAVANRLGIAIVVAGVLPEEKADAVARLRAAHGAVAFVGDGINDAPALASADTGIAMGGGTDVAMESADVVLMRSDPSAVLQALDTSRRTMRNIRQNLAWAFGYNVALIPVAAGALWPVFGVMLSPALAAVAMALSSLAVVTNALRLSHLPQASAVPHATAPPTVQPAQ